MSGFVSFLEKAGKILANVAAMEAGIEPLFRSAVPQSAQPYVDKADLIFRSVVATEGQFTAAFPGQQTGPQKLLAASSLVGPVLASIDTIRGKPIADEAAYTKAVQDITSAVANLLNSLKPTADATTGSVAVPAPAQAVAGISIPPATGTGTGT
jgi:hypothetical protein